MVNRIPLADQKWVKSILMPYFGIKALRLSWSDSKKSYPDIWCTPDTTPPVITVTREWARQHTDERRKRLVHEALHTKGLEDNVMVNGLYYCTYPDKDEYSRMVYEKISKGQPEKNPKLTTKQRDRLPDSAFAIPERRAYPIHDESHGRNALARVAQWGTASEKARVRKAVHARYPDIGQNPELEKVPAPVKPIKKEQEKELPKRLEELPPDWWRKLQPPPRWKPNPRKNLYDIYLEEVRKQWDWAGIARLLKLRDATRSPGDTSPVYFYLGNYLKIGPEGTGQHFHDKIWHYPPMYGEGIAGYRLGQWFEALETVAKEHDLHFYIPSDEDPTDIYVALGPSIYKSNKYWVAVERIEGWADATGGLTRAIRADQMKKPCPGCGGAIQRDDLIYEEEVPTGKMRAVTEYDYHTNKRKTTGKKKELIKHFNWHKECWLASRGKQSWYRPGILAEDISEEEEQAEVQRHVSHALPADYKFKPVVELPAENKPWWKRIAGRNPMRRYYNPALTPAPTPINIYAGQHPEPRQTTPAVTTAATPAPKASSSSMLTWAIVLLALGGAGFMAYFFFYKHKYDVGAVLEHGGASYQITELKYSGITHIYVMLKDSTTLEEYPVRDVDNDATWVAIS